MLKVFTSIKKVRKDWGKVKTSNFLHINFLQIYYQHHPKLKHLFFMDYDMRLYAHIFKLTFNKTKNYLDSNLLGNIFLRFIRFDVLYLTNSFITNIPSFYSEKAINLNQLLKTIRQNYSVIVIPDFLFKDIKIKEKNYAKIEIEEEMVLVIRSEWSRLEDYIADLKKKYRKKIKIIIERTKELEVRKLDSENLESYATDIQNLFNQVVRSSQFKGPDFNTSSFALFVKSGFMRVDGYFLNNRLVGFSSEIQKDKKLYSYFVGFDKNLNKSFPIYGRILIENITNAINLKKEHLVLGRTANEYKSNFGAIPIKSFVYIKIRNKYLRKIFNPIFINLRIQKWQQRSPFKITKFL